MKSANEIELMKTKWIATYDGLPQFSAFGDDNWGTRDYVAGVLDKCIGAEYGALLRMADVEATASDECGDKHDIAAKAIDWVTGKWDDFEDYCAE